ncbi:MAG: RsmE family RNA methyltransferase [Actinomycetota bacterium]|nr:RsmE family RNA methyltransferase [Actinomycetota bacterium]
MRHEWPRRVAALTQLRVDDINVPELSRDEDHHLRRVLRAREGEELVLCDGRGSWRFAKVAAAGLADVGEVFLDAPTPTTTLYLAPLKGERGEWAVAKATEVGVSEIVPLVSERVAQKFRGEARDRVVSRWRRVAVETAGQCRRSYDLVIADPVTPAEVPAHVAVADMSGSGDWRGVTSVAVGPEGGWSRDEWASTRRRVSLGPSVLRGETAAVVAGALVTFTNGSWGFTLGGAPNE